jgi:L-ectoine synthase
MIVRDLQTLIGSERTVSDAKWTSIRMLLADDNMGFKNHFESVYCMKGSGSITDLKTGETHDIRPGVMYALNEHDRHTLRADEELVMACVFNPPVTGREVHKADGSYALENS